MPRAAPRTFGEVVRPRVIRHLIDATGRALARVVHQAVKPSPPVDRRADEAFDVGEDPDVGPHGHDVASRGSQSLLGAREAIGVAPAHRHRAPSPTSSSASAAPSPSVPPVMAMTFPSRCRSITAVSCTLGAHDSLVLGTEPTTPAQRGLALRGQYPPPALCAVERVVSVGPLGCSPGCPGWPPVTPPGVPEDTVVAVLAVGAEGFWLWLEQLAARTAQGTGRQGSHARCAQHREVVRRGGLRGPARALPAQQRQSGQPRGVRNRVCAHAPRVAIPRVQQRLDRPVDLWHGQGRCT